MQNKEIQLSFSTGSIIAGTTIGAGMFTLPTVFKQAGWGLSLAYLIALYFLVVWVHLGYYRAIVREGSDKGLLGMVKKYLGSGLSFFAFLAIVLGNLLTLAIFLQLGSSFWQTLWPSWSWLTCLFFLWILVAGPAFMKIQNFAFKESIGITALIIAILTVVVFAPNLSFRGIASINWPEKFLPFGPILFALAGWTSVEPVYDLRKKFMQTKFSPEIVFCSATILVTVLYGLFVAGVLAFGDEATGLKITLALCGVLAIWNVYASISREIFNSLTKGINWNKRLAQAAVLLLPLVLVAIFGSMDIVRVVGLVGGLFLAAQYVFLIMVSAKVLKPKGIMVWVYNLLAVIFALAAVYELYYFVIG